MSQRERPADASAIIGAAPSSKAADDDPPPAPFDPLRLCVYTTVALLAWLLGPWAVAFFSALGFVGYSKARRRGLMRSDCLLRDTRLVLLYLALIAVAAGTRIVMALTEGTWR